MIRRPILWGSLAGLGMAILLAPWTGAALGTLTAARTARDAAAAALAAPVDHAPALQPDIAFPAAAGPAAIRSRIEHLARGGGVLVEELAPMAMPAPLVAAAVRVSGPEKAVLALADAVERERPMLRFRSWRIDPAEGGGIRLSGVLVGARR